jgi:ElaB/YqjD/DUF883 family membrane-anchored ribosome-binding protein
MTVIHKSAAELEREVEAQRAGLALTLDTISARLTPGQVLDEALQFAKGSGGGAFARNLGTSVRDNPLPIGLITSGIAWLISGRGGGLPRMAGERVPAPERRPAGDAFDRLRSDGVLPKKESGPGVFAKAASSTADLADTARERVTETAGIIGDAGRIAMDDLREGADRFSRSLNENAQHLGGRAREQTRYLRDRAGAFANEQPVVLAVAGLAIGALVGALARSTTAESRLMGQASEDVRNRAMDAASSGVETVVGVAERTYDAVREEAQSEGLTSSSLLNAADDVGRKLRKVAKKGQAKLEEELGAVPNTAESS